MKRLALTLVAGAFGTLMALPMAYAQNMQNMNNDAGSVPGDRTYNQATRETVEDYQSGPAGASSSQQVDVQKRSENVQNDALGATTEKQVDSQKRSAVQGGAFGPTTQQQVDVQKRSETVNNSMPNSVPDANE